MEIPNLKAIRDWCIGKFQSKGDYAEKSELDTTYQQATGYTDQKISELINGAPETLDTLKEIADAMSDNQDVVEALQTAIGSKADEQEFASHVANETIHIDATERTKWNNAVSHISDTSVHVTDDEKSLWNKVSDKVEKLSVGSSMSEETLNALLDAKQDKEIIILTDEMQIVTGNGVSTKNTLHGITYGNGIFVAVGKSGTVYYSEDGINWSAGSVETSLDLNSISYGNGKFIIVGGAGAVYLSSDGVTWEERDYGISDTLYDIAYNNNMFVAVGEDGVTYYTEFIKETKTVEDVLKELEETKADKEDLTAEKLQEMLRNDLLEMVYPVGSIYMSVNNVSPASFLGGTWTVWGSGRVPVGVNTSDSNFSTVEKTGGASSVSSSHSHTVNSHTHTTGSHALTVNELPAHTHSLSTGGNVLAMNASSGQTQYGWQMASGGWWNSNWKECASIASTGGGASHSHGNTGAATPGTTSASVSSSTLQPYITCYMWKRTA